LVLANRHGAWFKAMGGDGWRMITAESVRRTGPGSGVTQAVVAVAVADCGT